MMFTWSTYTHILLILHHSHANTHEQWCCVLFVFSNIVYMIQKHGTKTGLVSGVTAPPTVPVTAAPTVTPTQGPTGVALQCEGKKDCAIAYTPIYTIQGATDASPLIGQVVTTTGTVTLLLPEYEEIGYVHQFHTSYIYSCGCLLLSISCISVLTLMIWPVCGHPTTSSIPSHLVIHYTMYSTAQYANTQCNTNILHFLQHYYHYSDC
jgi:hypothetical protein